MGKLLLLLLVIAVVIYFVVRTIETRGHPFRRTPRRPGPTLPGPWTRRGPSRPLGPDDDPDFLRDLNRRPRKSDPDQPE